MEAIWIGPSGYVPGLGHLENGKPVQIANADWARALETEGKIKFNDGEPPRKRQSIKSAGGE